MKQASMILPVLFILLSISLLNAIPPIHNLYTSGLVVTCSAVDGDYIWVGTGGGLVKLNRNNGQMQHYNTLNSAIPDNHINCVYVDNQSVKWIGTSYGLVRFDGSYFTLYNPENSSMSRAEVYDVAQDPQGSIWVASRDYVMKYDGLSWTNIGGMGSPLMYKTLSSLAFAANGALWVGSTTLTANSGLYRWDGSNWTTFSSSNSGIGGAAINDIGFDAQGKLWVCHDFVQNDEGEMLSGGVSRLFDNTWTHYFTGNSGLTNNAVTGVAFSTDGLAWFTTENGLVSFNGADWTSYYVPYNISESGALGSISIDGQNKKWMGGNDKLKGDGLLILNDEIWQTLNTSSSGLNSNYITCLQRDLDEKLWVGTEKGLQSFDGNNWLNYTPLNSGIPYGVVHCVAIDSNNGKWFGVGNKLVSYIDGNWAVEFEYSAPITSIAIDMQNVKWLGVDDPYYGCLIRLDNGAFMMYNEENSALPGRMITDVYCDSQGLVWVTSSNNGNAMGLSRYEDDSWTNYSTANTLLPSNIIHGIVRDLDGIVWVATENGLAHFNGSMWAVYNSTNTTMPYNCVRGIAIDQFNNKWLSCAEAYDSGSSMLVKYFGNLWTRYNDAAPKYRGFNFISVDNEGSKWLASNNDELGLVQFFEGSVANEDYTATIPASIVRLTNSPNPFIHSTNIVCKMPNPETAELNIYNTRGQLVKTLYNDTPMNTEQSFVWDGSDNLGNLCAAGIYLCKLNSVSRSETLKMIKLQ